MPSSAEHLADLRARLRGVLRGLQLAETIVHDVVLAAHEAVVNAMIHAHRLDGERYVEVTLTAQASGITVRVADTGPGFDWRRWVRRAQEQPTAPDAPAGRGIMVMLAVMDDVAFSNEGNVVRMSRRLGPDA